MLNDASYKRIYRSSAAEASTVWNATGRSIETADTALDVVGHRFSMPGATDRNSYYDSVRNLLGVNSELGLACTALSLQASLQREVAFLQECQAIVVTSCSCTRSPPRFEGVVP